MYSNNVTAVWAQFLQKHIFCTISTVLQKCKNKSSYLHISKTKMQSSGRETYPGIIGYEWVWSSRRCAIRWEEVWFTDEGIVTFIIDSRVDEPTVHTPSTISWKKQKAVWFKIICRQLTGTVTQSNKKYVISLVVLSWIKTLKCEEDFFIYWLSTLQKPNYTVSCIPIIHSLIKDW